MNFVNRINECNALSETDTLNSIAKTLIIGEYGIGKSSLVRKVYESKDSIYVESISENYFKSIISALLSKNFHQYLLNRVELNYKDLFLNQYDNKQPQKDSLIDFILELKIFDAIYELNIESLMGEFIINSNICYLIFDDFENCDKDNYAQVLKFINSLGQIGFNRKITIVFVVSETRGFVYDNLIVLCDKIIPLEGLEIKYIEKILLDFFNTDNLECDLLAEFLSKKYQGNPGLIFSLLKLKFGITPPINLNQIEIFEKILSPRFFSLDPTEERILLYLSVMPFPTTKEQIKHFLKSDSQFFNIDNIETCLEKLKRLKTQQFVGGNNTIFYVDNVIRTLYREYSKEKLYLVYLIYNYQKKNRKSLSDRENAECLHFIFESKAISVTSEMTNSYFNYTTRTAILFTKNEMWKESVDYFNRVLLLTEHFTEDIIIYVYKAFYYNANYFDIKEFINNINDVAFKSYQYWYWKGNLLYMINDREAINCLDRAISYAITKNEKIYAQVIRKAAMSELPDFCSDTLNYYKNLLEEYKNDDYTALSTLYRNSLVLGGNDTIKQCDVGITIATKYNQNEELIKLNHNKHFELFRMSEYDGCENAFENTVRYFQNNKKRLYESAYGYNNLALLNLINQNLENARLYISSAVIYSSTPYSQIATQVNANLIESFFEKNESKITQRVNKIKQLIQKYSIEDNRIYRKSFFSIAISYINVGNYNMAKIYIRKSEQYLQKGNHINRYCNICKRLNIEPIIYPHNNINYKNKYYNFYSNPKYELWLLAFGHI